MLEEHGLLAHPHTSAGRVPTDSGYRYFVDRLLPAKRASARARARAHAPRGRRGDARHDRDAVADHEPAGDRLGAAAGHRDDPPHRGAAAAAADRDGRDHHLDRRRLQARADVRRARRQRPRRVGGRVPQRAARRHRPRRAQAARAPRRPDAVAQRARASWTASCPRSPSSRRPPRTRSTSTAPRGCCTSTASRTSRRSTRSCRCSRGGWPCWRCCAPRSATAATSSCGSAPRTRCPALRSLAMVAAGYGLPLRPLGTVSLIGPVAMDYAATIGVVREAAAQLSRFVEDVYDAADEASMPRDCYEVLGVGRGRRRGRGQEGLPQARARAAPRRQQPRPGGRGEVQGGRRGLRDPLRPRAPPGLRPLRPRGPAARRPGARTSRASARSRDLFEAFFGGGGFGGGGAAGRAAGGDVAGRRSRSTLEQAAAGAPVDVRYEAVDRCERCHGNGAEPGTPIKTCERCDGNGVLQAVSRTPFGQIARTVACDVCGGDGKVAEKRARAATAAAARCSRTP